MGMTKSCMISQSAKTQASFIFSPQMTLPPNAPITYSLLRDHQYSPIHTKTILCQQDFYRGLYFIFATRNILVKILEQSFAYIASNKSIKHWRATNSWLIFTRTCFKYPLKYSPLCCLSPWELHLNCYNHFWPSMNLRTSISHHISPFLILNICSTKTHADTITFNQFSTRRICSGICKYTYGCVCNLKVPSCKYCTLRMLACYVNDCKTEYSV